MQQYPEQRQRSVEKRLHPGERPPGKGRRDCNSERGREREPSARHERQPEAIDDYEKVKAEGAVERDAGEELLAREPVAATPAGYVAKGREVEDADTARERPVVRCKACEIRFEVPLDVELAECPRCGTKWRISWPAPGHAYVRGQA